MSSMNLSNRSSFSQKRLQGDRSGVILIWLGILAPVLILFVGLAIDLAIVLYTEQTLQHRADVIALSAALYLPDEDAASESAEAVAALNDPNIKFLPGAASKWESVKFGNWESDTRTWTEGGTPVNAVQVTLTRDERHGNEVPLYFFPLIGRDSMAIEVDAIAKIDHYFGGSAGAGMIGVEWVDDSGSAFMDGYDVTAGPYQGQNRGLPGSSMTNGWMEVGGSAEITGDARSGPAEPGADVFGSAIVSGSTDPLNAPMHFEPVEVPDTITSGVNDNALIYGERNGTQVNLINRRGTMTVLDNGTTGYMPSGDYYISNMRLQGPVTVEGPATIRIPGDFTTVGQGELRITGDGPVTIYVEGTMNTAGIGIVNLSGDPRNLNIYATGDTAEWTGSSDFYGYVYAPETEVKVAGTAEFYGGAVGRTLTMTGTGDIHTDKGLGWGGPNAPLPLLVD